jgi:hypothetical protein
MQFNHVVSELCFLENACQTFNECWQLYATVEEIKQAAHISSYGESTYTCSVRKLNQSSKFED